MNPIISIISPVYSAERYINKCIDSIIAQTFKEWELILVDDGSPDNSGSICDEYALKDERIRVIHKGNGGVSAARQTGLDAARGEYVIHVDPDDWVEHNMLEDMYNVIKEECLDILISDYYIKRDNNEEYISQKIDSFQPSDILFGILKGEIYGALWNKLVKSSILKKYTPCFYAGINYSEDVLFLTQLLIHNDVKVGYIGKAYYHYICTNNSITHNISMSTFMGLKKYYTKMQEILPIEPRFNEIVETFQLGAFSTGFMNYLYSESEIKKEFKKVRKLAYKTKSIRWKTGYICLDLNLFKLAHILLKY